MIQQALVAIVAATFGAVSLCGEAAQAADSKPPSWDKTPSAEQIRAVWPAKALRNGIAGTVKINCQVNIHGLAEDCRVVSEDPPGEGFGRAALLLAPDFLFKPATSAAGPVPSAVVIPINFALPTAAGQTPTGEGNAASPSPKSDGPQGNPSGAQRETARQLVELLHPDYELLVVLENKLSPIALHLSVETPDNVERIKAAHEAASKTLQDSLPALKLFMVEAYAREMSQDQLEDMLKFLGTPPGLAFSRAQGRLPLYFEISGADMWGQYVHSMLIEFCARTACTDKDRELMNERMGGPGR